MTVYDTSLCSKRNQSFRLFKTANYFELPSIPIIRVLIFFQRLIQMISKSCNNFATQDQLELIKVMFCVKNWHELHQNGWKYSSCRNDWNCHQFQFIQKFYVFYFLENLKLMTIPVISSIKLCFTDKMIFFLSFLSYKMQRNISKENLIGEMTGIVINFQFSRK